MTKEEIVVFLTQLKEVLLKTNSWNASTHKPIKESFDYAIKSILAWDEILTYLKKESEDIFVWDDTYEYEKGQLNAYEDAINIITAYLKRGDKK